jgi:hypothetical protein
MVLSRGYEGENAETESERPVFGDRTVSRRADGRERKTAGTAPFDDRRREQFVDPTGST